MDSPPSSAKETTNYYRLCRLLLLGGTQVLRDIFDSIHPQKGLPVWLSSHQVEASLQSLYKGKQKILNPTQWGKLYPADPSSVSSRDFDITLLMVLLRKIPGSNPPPTGWPPPATDTSIEADITRVRFYGKTVYAHASQASVDDLTFDKYWQDIRHALMRLGGEMYGRTIDKLEIDCMNPDIGIRYQELLKQWIEDERQIEQIEGNISET